MNAEGVQTTQAAGRAVPDTAPYADSTQCTYGAWLFAAEAGHKLPWFAGNATDWRQGALDAGLKVSDKLDPSVVNSVAVWRAGVGGTTEAGHVGWVTAVRDGEFEVKERNWEGPGVDGTRWVKWEEGISFITFGAQPSDLQVTQPLTMDETEPATGQDVHVRFTVKNTSSSAVTLQELVAGVRRGADWTGDPADFEAAKDITLQPGEEYTYEGVRTFAEGGDYVAQPMMKMEGYGWVPVNDAGGNTPRLSFSLQEQAALSDASETAQPEDAAQAISLTLRGASLLSSTGRP